MGGEDGGVRVQVVRGGDEAAGSAAVGSTLLLKMLFYIMFIVIILHYIFPNKCMLKSAVKQWCPARSLFC